MGVPGVLLLPRARQSPRSNSNLDFRFGSGGGLGLGGVGASLGVLPREGYQGSASKPWAPVEDRSPPRISEGGTPYGPAGLRGKLSMLYHPYNPFVPITP